MRPLMLGFRSLLRQPTIPSKKARTIVALHRWMDRVQATGIRSLQNFVGLLRRDVLAVEAAVTERWSNGPVEGQVNRLKTLKRQMYGRAGVELLRARPFRFQQGPPPCNESEGEPSSVQVRRRRTLEQ